MAITIMKGQYKGQAIQNKHHKRKKKEKKKGDSPFVAALDEIHKVERYSITAKNSCYMYNKKNYLDV